MKLASPKYWLLLALLGLQGCYHAQLNGGVAAAQLSLLPLDGQAEPLYQTRSWDPAFLEERLGSERWQAYNANAQLLLMGVFFLPKTFPTQQYYLLQARGGEDMDSDRNTAIDDTPAHVKGSWHAILPGQWMRQRNNKVSLLTEAAYQYLRQSQPALLMADSPDLGQQLDRLAQTLVDDINHDGVTDYLDVLQWNNYSHRQHYRGNPLHLDELATAISLGFSESAVQWAARRVVESSLTPSLSPPD